MYRPLAVALLLLTATMVLGEDQVTRVIPVRHGNAAEFAALFGGAPVETAGKPASPTMNTFLARCLASVATTFPGRAWGWQTFLESGPGALDGFMQSEPHVVRVGDGTSATVPAGAGPLKTLLPGNLRPPVAVLESNSLSLTGTAEEISRFREILDLLDRPRKLVVLHLTFLKGSTAAPNSFPGIDWNYPQGPDAAKANPPFRFARGKLDEALRWAADEPDTVAASLCAANNSSAGLQVAEVLPHYVKPDGEAAPLARNYVRALRLTFVPRINADDSVTLWLHGDYVAGATGTGTAATAPPAAGSRIANSVETQVRVASGETLLTALGKDTSTMANRWDDCGPNRLCYPLVAITPMIAPEPAGTKP